MTAKQQVIWCKEHDVLSPGFKFEANPAFIALCPESVTKQKKQKKN